MLSTGGVLLFAAAIAFASAHARVIGLCFAAIATVMLVIALGPAGGLVLAVVAAMGAGSVLALTLRPKPTAGPRRPRTPRRTASPPRSSRPGHSRARTLALVVGAPLAAIASGVVLIELAPFDAPLAFAIGTHAILPAWVALACLLPLARDGARAWAWCAGLLVAAACAASVTT